MVFRPNLTSELVAKGASQVITALSSRLHRPVNILELGCGNGAIGLSLIESSPIFDFIGEYCCSDIQSEAVEVARIRYADSLVPAKKNIAIHVRHSDLLDGWSDNELRDIDLIINDVSAVADEVSTYFRYFDGSVSNAGHDGLNNLRRFLGQVKARPALNCSVVFPVLSLSSRGSLIQLLEEQGLILNEILSKSWPMEMQIAQENIARLRELKEEGIIDFKEFGGAVVAETSVFELRIGNLK